MTAAAKTKLLPGTHSIDRVNPRKTDEGVYVLDWSVRTHGGKLLRRRSQGRTKGEARARARTKAADLLTTSGGAWAPSSPLTDYLDQVVQPSIENASTLKELSRSRYLASLKLVRHELKGYSIHDGTRFRVLEKSLQAIAQKKPGSVSSARTVLSKYLITQLIRDGLLDGNPLSGVSLDLEVPGGEGVSGPTYAHQNRMGHCGGASADPRREPAAYPVQTQEHQEEHAGSSRPSSQDDPPAGRNRSAHQ